MHPTSVCFKTFLKASFLVGRQESGKLSSVNSIKMKYGVTCGNGEKERTEKYILPTDTHGQFLGRLNSLSQATTHLIGQGIGVYGNILNNRWFHRTVF